MSVSGATAEQEQEEETVGKSRLFVSKLSKWITSEHLIEAFSCFGVVTDARVLLDTQHTSTGTGKKRRRLRSGRSRGCGFVGFATGSQALAAYQAAQESTGICIGTCRVGVDWAKGKSKESTSKQTPDAGSSSTSDKVFLRNLPFEVDEAEVFAWLSRVSKLPLASVKVQRDSLGKSKGFATATFLGSVHKLLEQCPQATMAGRLVSLEAFREHGGRSGSGSASAGLIDPEQLDDETRSQMSYRQLRRLRMRWRLRNADALAEDSARVWNPVTLAEQTAMKESARSLAVGKADLVLKSRDAAVGLALAETGVAQHCAEWLRQQGVDVDWKKERRDAVLRSRTLILIKNIAGSLALPGRLAGLFAKHGRVSSLKFPPESRAVALVQFADADCAANAFAALSFYQRRAQDPPLYLEWCPLSPKSKKRSLSEMAAADEQGGTAAEADDQSKTKLCVKNVAFEASAREVRSLFDAFGKVKSVRLPSSVSRKHHRGFAFVEFETHAEAKNAMAALTHTHFYQRKLVCQWAAS